MSSAEIHHHQDYQINAAELQEPLGQTPDEQFAKLQQLAGKGQYERIVQEDFPNIDPLDLAFFGFTARNTQINTLLGLARTAQDEELKRKLNVKAGNLIVERDRELNAALGEVPGEPNEEALARQRATSTSKNDEFGLLMQMAGYGLHDEMIPSNFPHMAGMQPRTRTRLQMIATSNDIAHLEGARNLTRRDPGFTTGLEQDTPGLHSDLGSEISTRRSSLRSLAKGLINKNGR